MSIQKDSYTHAAEKMVIIRAVRSRSTRRCHSSSAWKWTEGSNKIKQPEPQAAFEETISSKYSNVF